MPIHHILYRHAPLAMLLVVLCSNVTAASPIVMTTRSPHVMTAANSRPPDTTQLTNWTPLKPEYAAEHRVQQQARSTDIFQPTGYSVETLDSQDQVVLANLVSPTTIDDPQMHLAFTPATLVTGTQAGPATDDWYPFDSNGDLSPAATLVTTITVAADTDMLVVGMEPAFVDSNVDLDLYVGSRLNAQGKPLPKSSVCSSLSSDSSEHCSVSDPTPGDYWVVVHTYAGDDPAGYAFAVSYTTFIPETPDTGIQADLPDTIAANTPFAVTFDLTLDEAQTLPAPGSVYDAMVVLQDGDTMLEQTVLHIVVPTQNIVKRTLAAHPDTLNPYANDNIVYEIQVRPLIADEVGVEAVTYTLVDQLDKNVFYIADSAQINGVASDPVVGAASDLDDGSVWQTLTWTLQHADLHGITRMTYSVECKDWLFDDWVRNNATLTYTPPILPEQTTDSVPVDVRPAMALDLVKQGATSVPATGLITYTLTVTNTGSIDIQDMRLSDMIPEGTHYASGASLADVSEVVTWKLDLAAAATSSVSYTVRVDARTSTPYTYTPPPPAGRVPGVQPQVVGGHDAQLGDWPWMVSLEEYGEQICGATLIAPRVALTATHCVARGTTLADGLYPSSSYSVRIGITDLTEATSERLPVQAFLPLPDYDATDILDIYNDLTLVLLERPSSAPIVGLVSPDLLALAAPGVMSTIIGWGDTQEGEELHPDILQQATIPIVANEVCQFYNLTDKELCAGFAAGGVDTCSGDSGGPLLVPNADRSGYLQAGITSYGVGCARPDAYGIYTRVSAYYPWIVENTERLMNDIVSLGSDFTAQANRHEQRYFFTGDGLVITEVDPARVYLPLVQR